MTGESKVEYYKGYAIQRWKFIHNVYEVWSPTHWVDPTHPRSRDFIDTFKTRREAITFIESEIAAGRQKERR